MTSISTLDFTFLNQKTSSSEKRFRTSFRGLLTKLLNEAFYLEENDLEEIKLVVPEAMPLPILEEIDYSWDEHDISYGVEV